MNQLIKAYISDLDGTLFDTKAANLVSYEKAFRLAGVTFSKELYESAFGLRFNEMMEVLAPGTNDKKKNEIKENKKKLYAQNLDLILPNYGLITLLRELKCAGNSVALATTAQSSNAKSVLSFFKVDDLFDVTVFGEEVSRGKPNPECYTKIIEKLGIKASECLIFEDSEVGVRAAIDSGASVVKIAI